MMPRCQAPIPDGTLLDYWARDLADGDGTDRVEEHLFACGDCSARLDVLATLGAGLATLAGTYRNSVTAPGSTADIDECAKAVRLIHGALESLERNPNERLLVENLLWSLPDAHGV